MAGMHNVFTKKHCSIQTCHSYACQHAHLSSHITMQAAKQQAARSDNLPRSHTCDSLLSSCLQTAATSSAGILSAKMSLMLIVKML
jgi:S-methylmethionine-dependent homocysteine/selenocysteine methylase